MSVALRDRPADVETTGGGRGAPARRAIARWSWRLFRREWRQQVLVLALVLFAVAATIVGVALVYNTTQSVDSTFGTANSMMAFPGSDRADIAATRKAFGPVEEIAHQTIAIPGSLDTIDLRAQDPKGKYGYPTLRLLTGRYPSGAQEIAMTRGASKSLDVRVGATVSENGENRRVVGLVENPLDLNDDFALVAPGQANPPAQVLLLFDAGGRQVTSFPAGGNATQVGTRGAASQNSAAVAVLALETIGLLFVGLVAAAGFAVMAQRRLRALGMLGALGATDRQVRFAMIANGAVVGAAGAVVGAVAGLITWLVLAPWFERLVRHRVDRFHLPWWAIAAAMALAVVTAIVAAWWPARAAARQSIVTALAGRPAPPKPAHRFAGAGGVLLAAGFGCLAFADQKQPNTVLIITGTIATTFGMLFLGPLFIGALASAGRRAPIALRLALRDLARYRARSAAALGAISLALAIAATIAISASALAVSPGEGNLPANQAIVHLGAGNDFFFVNAVPALTEQTGADLHATEARVDALAASIHAQSVVPLTEAINPASGTVSGGAPPSVGGGNGSVSVRPQAGHPAPGGGATNVVVPVALAKVTHLGRHGRRTGIEITDGVPLYVATPALLHFYGLGAGSIRATADVISGRHDLAGLVITSPQGGPTPCDASQPKCRVNGVKPKGPATVPGPYEIRPNVQTVKLPAYTSAPDTLLTAHALRAFGLKTVVGGWLIQTRAPLTAAQINAAQQTAAAAGAIVETKNSHASFSQLRNWATGIGLLVALGVLAMTVGLIRSETANDLRTLAATGATSTTRRTLTGATAGALALLGALLGTGGAYLALVAWHRSDLHPLTRVPFLDLAILIVGLPVVAIGAGWLLAGRESASIAHQPLE